jgi:hypothetical protein
LRGGEEMGSTSKARKKRSRPYTTGELNRLVDDLCHPFYKENPSYMLVDAVLHGLIERNPPESVRKFLRYNLPTTVKQALKQLR